MSAIYVVVMGVAGCGKSAVAKRIAAPLNLPTIEGDDFHPPANKAKMTQGTPLNDDDRAPVTALALTTRFATQGKGDYAAKLLAQMRAGFGGHAVKKQ